MISQLELCFEGFWSAFKKPFKVAGGVIGAATKGIAAGLDYVAPQITQPLHSLETAARDIGSKTRLGWDAGYGGREKLYSDILSDSGYVMDHNFGVKRSGKNYIVGGWRAIVDPKTHETIPDKKGRQLTFVFDRNNQFKIVSTSTQDTSSMSKYGQIKAPKKQRPYKSVKPKKKP